MAVAPSFVQSNSSADVTNTSVISCAFTNSQPANNLILVCISFDGVLPGIFGVKDSAGNLYEVACQEIEDTNYTHSQAVYYCKNSKVSAAGNLVTVTLYSTRTNKNLQILEYTGADLLNPIDVSSENTSSLGSSTTVPSAPAISTVVTNSIIVCFLEVSASVVATPPAGFTSRISDTIHFCSDGPAAVISSYTPHWTLAQARNNIVSQVALGPAPISISFVQLAVGSDAANTSTVSATYASSQSSGNCNVVCIDFTGASPDISVVDDLAGNTYSVACAELFDSGYNHTQAVYIAKNITSASAGSNTVTVHLTAARTTKNIEIFEYSGVNLISPLDGTSQTNSALGDNQLNPQAPSITTTKANDRIICFLNVSSLVTPITPPTGFTSRISASTNAAADGPAINPGVYSPKWGLQGNRFNTVSQLAVTPVPIYPGVTFLPANFLSPNSAILNGLITSAGTGPILTYGFHWGFTASYGNTITTTSSLGNIPFSSTITGLLPSTKYHFRAFASNSAGTRLSLDTIFITPAVVTHLPVVGTNTVTSATETYNLNAVTFQDEFDSPLSQYDGTLNQGTWATWFYYGAQNSQNSRVENSVSCIFSDVQFNGYQPFTIANSLLTITADNNPAFPTSTFPFLSGTITTKNSYSQLYGYFECRCRTNPMAVGVWPAFWMMASDIPSHDARREIDIMEDFADPVNVVGHVHDLIDNPNVHETTGNEVVGDTTQFHIYGLLWTPSFMYFYVDDVQKAFLTNPYSVSGPQYLIATLQTGTASSFLGIPTQAEIPIKFDIDFIRAYSIVLAGSQPITIHLLGIPTAEVFPSGNPGGGVWDGLTVTWTDLIHVWDDLAAAVSAGIVIVMGNANQSITGVASSQAFGNLSVQMPATIQSIGIASAELLGSLTLIAPLRLSFPGIPSSESFGLPFVFIVNIGTPVRMARCL